jgi:hypothetical protein
MGRQPGAAPKRPSTGLSSKNSRQELGGGDHKDVGHCSWGDAKVFEHKVVLLFPRGGKADGPQIDEDGMSLEMCDVVEAVICRWQGGPRRGRPASMNRVVKRRSRIRIGHISLGGKVAPTVPM